MVGVMVGVTLTLILTLTRPAHVACAAGSRALRRARLARVLGRLLHGVQVDLQLRAPLLVLKTAAVQRRVRPELLQLGGRPALGSEPG